MRVLMLGWEFPPLITGGLGTACAGLTRALVDQGVEIDFVLPRPVESRLVDGVRVLSPGCEELTSATKDESPTPTADQKQGIPCETPPPSPFSSAAPASPTHPQLLDPIPGLPELNPEQTQRLESIGSGTGSHLPYPFDTTPEPVATFLQTANGNPIRAAQALDAFVNQGGEVPAEQQVLLRQWLGKPGRQQAHQPQNPRGGRRKDSSRHRSCACVYPRNRRLRR